MKKLYAALVPLLILLFPAVALAAPDERHGLALDPTQTYTLLIGALVPLVTYVINHYAPWCSEHVKALVHVVAAAIAGGLYEALSSGGFGWNSETLQICGTAVVSALIAHNFLYVPSGINQKFKGGTNKQAAVPNA